jgi:hypothetical protein
MMILFKASAITQALSLPARIKDKKGIYTLDKT